MRYILIPALFVLAASATAWNGFAQSTTVTSPAGHSQSSAAGPASLPKIESLLVQAKSLLGSLALVTPSSSRFTPLLSKLNSVVGMLTDQKQNLQTASVQASPEKRSDYSELLNAIDSVSQKNQSLQAKARGATASTQSLNSGASEAVRSDVKSLDQTMGSALTKLRRAS